MVMIDTYKLLSTLYLWFVNAGYVRATVFQEHHISLENAKYPLKCILPNVSSRMCPPECILPNVSQKPNRSINAMQNVIAVPKPIDLHRAGCIPTYHPHVYTHGVQASPSVVPSQSVYKLQSLNPATRQPPHTPSAPDTSPSHPPLPSSTAPPSPP